MTNLGTIKKCTTCRNVFTMSRELHNFCSRKCKTENMRKELLIKYTNNLDYREKSRGYQIKNKFGINLEQYNQMLIDQENRCAICNIHQLEVGRRFAIDHDHKTGKIRGLLCASCNTGLGGLKDSPELLKIAINYLGKK